MFVVNRESGLNVSSDHDEQDEVSFVGFIKVYSLFDLI